ncbi:MAG: secondary thiamine-phosphate synthase enzyme YjbQ [Candidatus Heimdallarchaeota archaeon]|nr:secondary thiamine-phosphate synthase enzyme YjbQ [Candidatus Heimdallarchaeota archaeon]
MKVLTKQLEIETKGKFDIVNITDLVQENVRLSLIQEGNVTIFVPASTAAIATIEYESGLVKDIQNLCEKLIPSDGTYFHTHRLQDGNGHAQLRSSLMKTSLTVPFRQAKLLLGSWQHIIFIEFDNRPQTRNIITQIIGT